VQLRNELHPYRRTAQGECFVAIAEIPDFHGAFKLNMLSQRQNSILSITFALTRHKKYNFAGNFWASCAPLAFTTSGLCSRASVRRFIYTQ
jgi:hypothetical protein